MDAPPNCQAAGPRRGETSPFLDQEVTSSRPGGDQKEESSREWTNEKHSLYLNSMEASFVNECLYESSELLGWPPRPRKWNPSVAPPSGQFKVVRGGLWQKMKFARAENQDRDEWQLDEIQSNPWIKRFRCSRRGRDPGSMFIRENNVKAAAASVSRSGQQRVPFTTSTTQSPPRNNPLYHHHDSVGNGIGTSTINIEVSDQNFLEDETETETEDNREGIKTADKLTDQN